MKYAIIAGLFLSVAACAGPGPVTKAHAAYAACIDAKGAANCADEKAKFDAALAVANAQSQRSASRGPLILRGPEPPAPVIAVPSYETRRPITCSTVGGITTCI